MSATANLGQTPEKVQEEIIIFRGADILKKFPKENDTLVADCSSVPV